MITSMTKPAIRRLRAELQDDLNAMAKKYGLTFQIGNGSFDDVQVTFKLQCALAGEDVGKREWDRHAFAFGLSENDYGKSFAANGHRYTICGIKPRSRKYPVLARREDGQVYKHSARAVLLFLRASEAT